MSGDSSNRSGQRTLSERQLLFLAARRHQLAYDAVTAIGVSHAGSRPTPSVSTVSAVPARCFRTTF
jgi:hypothetical protein